MWKFKPQHLSSSLRDTINQIDRLKAIKSEMEHNAKQEIVQHLNSNKKSRARIQVEKIIQEENHVEALEIIQMYCDTLHKKSGLIQSME
ncbi:hypothetical protein GDO81_015844 [Engystomops pustulosus]|uniref:IST1 homolog n=2 Tax=Engystomops pustulosus TaxID=76066 RepID=A0AAV7ANH9_ENGPU|nr:hypothetical protein GDO81_015844 [Engystomops pustulosus]